MVRDANGHGLDTACKIQLKFFLKKIVEEQAKRQAGKRKPGKQANRQTGKQAGKTNLGRAWCVKQLLVDSGNRHQVMLHLVVNLK